MSDTLRKAVTEARAIHGAHNLFTSDDFPWRVEVTRDLQRITRKALATRHGNPNYEIVYDSSTLNTQSLLGSSIDIPTKEKAIILISAAANDCWTRFTLAKELMHLYTGCQASLNIPAEVAIKDAQKSRTCVLVSADEELDAETYCHYLAVELMISWKYRDEIMTEKHVKRASNRSIAKALKVPEVIVKAFFDEGYDEISHVVNASL